MPTPRPRTRRDWLADGAAVAFSLVFGAAILLSALYGSSAKPVPAYQVVVDIVCGVACCLALWWRRRWPLGVALVGVVLGTVTTSGTVGGLVALFSLAVHRRTRPVVTVAVLFVLSALVFAFYRPHTDPLAALLVAAALVLAATAWGMYVRARRQLLLSLRERAERAEADQRVHEDGARMAERSRIAREMHDVLAHRISLVALHAGGLEVRPDLPAEKVRETAELLRSTARQALEELRAVIGVLREDPASDQSALAPQPTLSDIPRLVHDMRQAGAKIELEMRVDEMAGAPTALGRDAYRIVQEALTNISKHAHGTAGRVSVDGAPDNGLRINVRNRLPLHVHSDPTLPGSGAGLLGLQERVTLAGGTLVHGPDGSGDFVVDAELRW
jgi:signal transduction histidine kinase